MMKINHKRQTTDVAWWPKPATWDKCGLSLGFWTMDCELWFQKRWKVCQEGQGQLKTTKQWKSDLKVRPRVERHGRERRIHSSNIYNGSRPVTIFD